MYKERYTEVLSEIASVDSRLRDLDYIGVKIAMGRASREEYAEEIAEANRLAERKNQLTAERDRLWPLVAEEQERLMQST